MKSRSKPGSFLYYGGMVFEVDNCGKRRPRKDIGPGTRGKFKHKHFTGVQAVKRKAQFRPLPWTTRSGRSSS